MKKENPVAVLEVTRGDFVESKHEVDVVVADASGTIVSSWGEPERLVFPRSAIKSLQALALVESGAADAFGFQPKHLALACSSHNGETIHVDAAKEMLQLAAVGETCLECGAQLPRFPEDQAELVRSGGEASPIHNNCSGKHAGLIAYSAYQGFDPIGYVGLDHPVQNTVAAILEDTLDYPHKKEHAAIDGCSIPTYQVPLRNLAIAYAKFGIAETQGRERAGAMRRLREACLAHPEMVAGKNRACTKLMQLLGDLAFVKIGAEGVYIASLPQAGLGMALKVRDGAERAAETAISSLLAEFLQPKEEIYRQLIELAEPELRNRRNKHVGNMRLVL